MLLEGAMVGVPVLLEGVIVGMGMPGYLRVLWWVCVCYLRLLLEVMPVLLEGAWWV